MIDSIDKIDKFGVNIIKFSCIVTNLLKIQFVTKGYTEETLNEVQRQKYIDFILEENKEIMTIIMKNSKIIE